MAKGIQKGNRETRKPKSDKPKVAAAAASPFQAAGGKGKVAVGAGKKGR
jgi:hypothetical protein